MKRPHTAGLATVCSGTLSLAFAQPGSYNVEHDRKVYSLPRELHSRGRVGSGGFVVKGTPC
jgi:hypothetical protein